MALTTIDKVGKNAASLQSRGQTFAIADLPGGFVQGFQYVAVANDFARDGKRLEHGHTTGQQGAEGAGKTGNGFLQQEVAYFRQTEIKPVKEERPAAGATQPMVKSPNNGQPAGNHPPALFD